MIIWKSNYVKFNYHACAFHWHHHTHTEDSGGKTAPAWALDWGMWCKIIRVVIECCLICGLMDTEIMGGVNARGCLAHSTDAWDIWKGFSMFSTYWRGANYISSRLTKKCFPVLCISFALCSSGILISSEMQNSVCNTQMSCWMRLWKCVCVCVIRFLTSNFIKWDEIRLYYH